MFVHAIPCRRCGRRCLPIAGRVDHHAVQAIVWRRQSIVIRSTGSVSGRRGAPQSDRRPMWADARPTLRRRSRAPRRRSAVRASVGVPGRRATNGWTCSIVPESIARYQADRDRPEASSVMRPWWPRAQSSNAESLTRQRGRDRLRGGIPAVLSVVVPESGTHAGKNLADGSKRSGVVGVVAVEVLPAVGAGVGERAPAARRTRSPDRARGPRTPAR